MKIYNISVKSWLWLHLVQIKIIMYRNYMHLKMTVKKERREGCAQDVVRILWREHQKMGIIEVLSFLDALVIPNVIILGILNSLRPSKIHQYVSKCCQSQLKRNKRECGSFLGLNYNARPSSVIYSFGLLLFKPIFILSFLNQLRYLSMKYMKSSRVQPFQSLP